MELHLRGRQAPADDKNFFAFDRGASVQFRRSVVVALDVGAVEAGFAGAVHEAVARPRARSRDGPARPSPFLPSIRRTRGGRRPDAERGKLRPERHSDCQRRGMQPSPLRISAKDGHGLLRETSSGYPRNESQSSDVYLSCGVPPFFWMLRGVSDANQV